ncbi:hypothetical protein HK405_010327 [Cladochytrium tenue]|nr:hypothetical protein HK405_010327 [Cladochytrium tenue]
MLLRNPLPSHPAAVATAAASPRTTSASTATSARDNDHDAAANNDDENDDANTREAKLRLARRKLERFRRNSRRLTMITTAANVVVPGSGGGGHPDASPVGRSLLSPTRSRTPTSRTADCDAAVAVFSAAAHAGAVACTRAGAASPREASAATASTTPLQHEIGTPLVPPRPQPTPHRTLSLAPASPGLPPRPTSPRTFAQRPPDSTPETPQRHLTFASTAQVLLRTAADLPPRPASPRAYSLQLPASTPESAQSAADAAASLFRPLSPASARTPVQARLARRSGSRSPSPVLAAASGLIARTGSPAPNFDVNTGALRSPQPRMAYNASANVAAAVAAAAAAVADVLPRPAPLTLFIPPRHGAPSPGPVLPLRPSPVRTHQVLANAALSLGTPYSAAAFNTVSPDRVELPVPSPRRRDGEQSQLTGSPAGVSFGLYPYERGRSPLPRPHLLSSTSSPVFPRRGAPRTAVSPDASLAYPAAASKSVWSPMVSPTPVREPERRKSASPAGSRGRRSPVRSRASSRGRQRRELSTTSNSSASTPPDAIEGRRRRSLGIDDVTRDREHAQHVRETELSRRARELAAREAAVEGRLAEARRREAAAAAVVREADAQRLQLEREARRIAVVMEEAEVAAAEQRRAASALAARELGEARAALAAERAEADEQLARANAARRDAERLRDEVERKRAGIEGHEAALRVAAEGFERRRRELDTEAGTAAARSARGASPTSGASPQLAVLYPAASPSDAAGGHSHGRNARQAASEKSAAERLAVYSASGECGVADRAPSASETRGNSGGSARDGTTSYVADLENRLRAAEQQESRMRTALLSLASSQADPEQFRAAASLAIATFVTGTGPTNGYPLAGAASRENARTTASTRLQAPVVLSPEEVRQIRNAAETRIAGGAGNAHDGGGRGAEKNALELLDIIVSLANTNQALNLRLHESGVRAAHGTGSPVTLADVDSDRNYDFVPQNSRSTAATLSRAPSPTVTAPAVTTDQAPSPVLTALRSLARTPDPAPPPSPPPPPRAALTVETRLAVPALLARRPTSSAGAARSPVHVSRGRSTSPRRYEDSGALLTGAVTRPSMRVAGDGGGSSSIFNKGAVGTIPVHRAEPAWATTRRDRSPSPVPSSTSPSPSSPHSPTARTAGPGFAASPATIAYHSPARARAAAGTVSPGTSRQPPADDSGDPAAVGVAMPSSGAVTRAVSVEGLRAYFTDDDLAGFSETTRRILFGDGGGSADAIGVATPSSVGDGSARLGRRGHSATPLPSPVAVQASASGGRQQHLRPGVRPGSSLAVTGARGSPRGASATRFNSALAPPSFPASPSRGGSLQPEGFQTAWLSPVGAAAVSHSGVVGLIRARVKERDLQGVAKRVILSEFPAILERTHSGNNDSPATADKSKAPAVGTGFRVPLLLAVMSVVFAMTGLVGGITAYMSLSAAQSTALDIASTMEQSLLQSASSTVRAAFSSVVNITVEVARDPALISFVAQGAPYSWLSRSDILTKIFRRQQMLSNIAFCGMFFRPAANGSQAFVALVPSSGQIQFQDQSVNNNFLDTAITGVDSKGLLTFADANAGFVIVPGGVSPAPYSTQPYWTPPSPASGVQTYVLAYGLPVWSSLLAPQSSSTLQYEAVHAMWFSARSLDAFLQTIPTTPNAVLALIDGHTGSMVAASAPNISVVWPTQYPAVGNPNAMLSAASSQLLSLYSSGPANDTTSFSLITDRTSQKFRFSFGGDTLYCSTSWIVDDASLLSLAMILVVPANDLLGPMTVTTRNSIIFVVLFTAFAFGLGGLLAWGMAAPLRRVTVSVKKATKFDFSSLQEGLVTSASWMMEIIDLEDAFSTMLKKFAAAIDRNKSLVAQNYSQSVAGSEPSSTKN